MRNKFTISKGIIYAVVTLVALCCVLPMLLVVMTSFTDEAAIARNGYSLFPEKFSLMAYKTLFANGEQIARSYMISIAATVVGGFLSVLITYMAGFVLANRQFRYRNQFAMFFYITTVFNAGLVPQYLMIKALGIYDTFWALIIPGMVSTLNIFLVRNYINGIPFSLMESARVDGAGLVRIAFQIYLPVCKPVLATITLFYGIGYWNNYFNALMFVDDTKLYPLQMILFQLQSSIEMVKQLTMGVTATPPAESIKMATTVVTVGPIILLYPFLQKYFIKGIVVGAVKG